MKRIIITADDYGMCEDVDKAIRDCVDVGVCKSFNVITNMGQLSIDEKYLRNPNISIGLHWNVTAGKPTLPVHCVRSLCDNEGNFWTVGAFQKKMKTGEINIQELELELRNQYTIYQETFGMPAYWNTHQNSSFSPATMRAFSSVARDLHIPCTRNFQRVYMTGMKIGGAKRNALSC